MHNKIVIFSLTLMTHIWSSESWAINPELEDLLQKPVTVPGLADPMDLAEGKDKGEKRKPHEELGEAPKKAKANGKEEVDNVPMGKKKLTTSKRTALFRINQTPVLKISEASFLMLFPLKSIQEDTKYLLKTQRRLR